MNQQQEMVEKQGMLIILVYALADEYLYKSGLIAPTKEEKEKVIKLVCKNRGFDYDRLFG